MTNLLAAVAVLLLTPTTGAPQDPVEPPPCNGCVLGPVELTATPRKAPTVYTTEFTAVQGEYKLLIRSDARPGAILLLTLNGVALPPIASQNVPVSGHVTLDVRLLATNRLIARAIGRPDLRFVLEIPRPFPPGLCPGSDAFLVHPTTPPDRLAAIVPLGNLYPPEHVLPTHHLYMSPPAGGDRLPIHAPYPGRVSAIGRADDRGDYYVFLTICEGLEMYVIHVAELAPRLAWLALEPFGGYRPRAAFSSSAPSTISPPRSGPRSSRCSDRSTAAAGA